MRNQQLTGCSTAGLVIGNVKDCSFKGHIGASNSFVVIEHVLTNTSREVYHSNCGETTLNTMRYSYGAK